MPEIIEIHRDADRRRASPTPAGGDVFFDVAKDPELRQAQQPLGRRAAGRRRRSMPRRSDRPATSPCGRSAKPGEPAWDSPWGKGRPGWHIECSAMSRGAARRNVRYSRRRARSDVPAPRERNRPKRMLPRQADGEVLAAQRPAAGRPRQAKWAADRDREAPPNRSNRPRPARSAAAKGAADWRT